VPQRRRLLALQALSKLTVLGLAFEADKDGRPWATVLCGPEGFISFSKERKASMVVAAQPLLPSKALPAVLLKVRPKSPRPQRWACSDLRRSAPPVVFRRVNG
jgi:hypothetical protein